MPLGMLPLFSCISSAGGGPPSISAASRTGAVQYTTTGLQDLVGGNDVSITGTNFVNGCTVDYKQAGNTIASSPAVTFLNSTNIQATNPALAVGIYDLVVTNPDMQNTGASGDALHESYTLTADTWGCLLEPGNYDPDGSAPGVGQWTDTSGNANHAINNGINTNPTSNSGCPVFDGTASLDINESLVAAEASITPMASALAGTIIMFFESDTTDLDVSNYGNRGLITGSGASPGIYHSALGLKAVSYSNNALYDSAYSPNAVSVGEVHMGVMTWTDVLISCIVDGGVAGTNVLVDGIPDDTNTGAVTYIGRSYAAFYQGTIRAVAIANTVLTELHLAKIREWGMIIGQLPSEYFVPSVINDAGLFTYHASSDLNLSGGDTIVTKIPDLVGDDINKDLYPDVGLGSDYPLYTAVDVNFGNQPSWGDDYAADTSSWMVSTDFAVPLAQPFTAYNVFRVITDISGADKYVTINRSALATQSALLFGTQGALEAGVGAGTFAIGGPSNDTTVVVCVVYNGASSEAYINTYSTTTGTGDIGGLGDYESIGTGSPVGSEGRLRQAEKIVSAAAHNLTLRKKYMGYLAARYKLPIAI